MRTEQAGTNIHWMITKHRCQGLINENKQVQEGDQIRKDKTQTRNANKTITKQTEHVTTPSVD